MSQGSDHVEFVPEKKGMPIWLKLGLGCGTICILSCLGMCGGGYWWITSTIDEFTQKYEDQGYRKVSGQQLSISDPINEPTVIVAQQLDLDTEVNADIAILAQICEIEGTINGDIDVMGQVIHIKKDAVINGDIRVEWAQVIQVEGTVTGEITGEYTILEDRRENSDAVDSDEPAAEGMDEPDKEPAEGEPEPADKEPAEDVVPEPAGAN
jgi:hypothetical protein